MPGPFSKEIPELLTNHYQHLVDSAISTEVIKERGYRSVLGKTPLREAGFSKAQCRAPGILIPLHGTEGGVHGYQYRPDNPRSDSNWRKIKYENPTGSTVRIDVPPRCRQQLGDPEAPLYITEGVKKVDSLASAGVCAIGLTGVWGFKGKNPLGGTTILTDFDYITWKERLVYIVFDSDSSTNPHVRQAMVRLSEILSRKGARIRIITLPPGPDGEKVGVDDYLQQGHTVSELITLEEINREAVREAIEAQTENVYRIENGVLCWEKPTQHGSITVPMCNFDCHIKEHVIKDDGRDRKNFFRIVGTTRQGEPLSIIDVPTESFGSLKWVLEEWGLRAIIEPGQNIKDRLQHAVLLQSQEAPVRGVYTHTGWREIDGQHYFLNVGGAIGGDETIRVDVELESALQKYILLPPEGDPAEAVRASLDFLLIGELPVTLPLWTSMYLAPLSTFIDTAFTLWYVASSGSFKSVLTALALNHFGTFDHLTLPASWQDTENELEKLLFLAKDVPLIIDDWYPGEDSADARRLAVKAGRIIRSQGNRQGRGRMRADLSLRAGYQPRGLLISSGEQLPAGHSQTSRVITVEMEKSEIFRDFLTYAQTQEKCRLYNSAMAHYIKWISLNWKELSSLLPQIWHEQRESFYENDRHARLAGDIASLCTGLHAVARFATETGAMEPKEAESLKSVGVDIFSDMVSSQSERVEDERPSKRFISVMSAMIAQGRAVFASKEDEAPRTPVPGTFPVGWYDFNGTYFFNPSSSYNAVYQFCQQSGHPFTFREDAVWKDLKRQGVSICDEDRTKFSTRIYGEKMRVIQVKKEVFTS